MKKSAILFFLVTLFIFSCSDDNDDNLESEINGNNVVLLKIDYLTHSFEGGKELTFESATDFTITANYQPPGDFGSIKLMYDEVDEPLFEGTIVWMGLGERNYPETMHNADDFPIIPEAVDMPNVSMFTNIMYDENAYYDEDLDYSLLWDAIKNLEIVRNYRNSNPNETIKVFLYTPSVGIGNPADWDYYLILKN